ncbi:hypothetical protein Acf1_00015 [Acidovorax phage ACF1]|nr:hypothetical protein Acf1_00015 [Acidovorax phage ACF1]
MTRITCEQAVLALKELRTSHPAKSIALHLGTDARAVATALRAATNDGRVSCSWSKGLAYYRFVRLSPKKGGAA